MAEMTYLLTAKEKCEMCDGQGTIRHPVARLFYQDKQSRKTLEDYFEHFDLPFRGSITCPACDGKGYFERTVTLDDALADLARR